MFSIQETFDIVYKARVLLLRFVVFNPVCKLAEHVSLLVLEGEGGVSATLLLKSPGC